MKKILLCATVFSLLTAVAQAQNENITWQAPNTVSGASDVSALGTYFGSWAPGDGGANTLPVNGVTFQGNSDLPGFNTTGFDNSYNGYANPNTGNGNYNALLQYAAYDDTGAGSDDTVTWSDVPGHSYLIEIWANDGRGLQRSETVTGGANTSGTLNFGTTPTYIVGTYVADNSGSETITLSGFGAQGDYPQINLLLIRDITPANITWQTPAAISAASDVSTQGVYFGSWAPYSSSSLTVNGVTFQNFTDLPDFSSTGFNSGYTGFPNPGTANNNYNTLLQAGAYDGTGNGANDTISWGGMTPGHTYLVQFWVNGNDSARTESLTGGANASATINYEPGQYIVGTFVAIGSGAETITLNGEPSDNYPQVNLLQVRDITPAPTFTNYQSAVLSDHPLGYWPLNFNLDTNTDDNGYYIATDLSGNTNNGTYYGITPSGNDVAGPTPYITNAVSFDYSEVDLSTGSNIALLNFTGPTTLEAWAQPALPASDLNSLGDIIAKGYDSANYQEIALRENDIYVSGTANYYGYFGSGGLSGGQENTNWVHLVLANDGSRDSFYINGVLVANSSDSTGSILFSDFITWAIGNGTSGGYDRTFDGNICQVAIYNYGLTSTQVLNHFYEAELNAPATTSRPIIVGQPQAQSSYAGGSVTFSVSAVSAFPMTNQWYKNGSPLSGQTNATLTISEISANNVANYTVTVGNSNGTTNSVSAALTLLTPGNPLEWSPNSNNGLWDVNTSANWINETNSVQTVFNQGDQVLFDDTPGVPTTVTVNGTVDPSVMTVNSSANNFSIGSGTISGSGSLIKEGSSVLTITSGGNFTGTATINGGALYAGNNCLDSVSSITITNNSTLDLAGGTISDNPLVTVSGTGLNGEGAIFNSYDDYPAELLNINLAGDTKFGGSARWDLASSSQISGAHNLTVDMSADANDGYYSQWNALTIAANVAGVIVTNGSGFATNMSNLGMANMDVSCQNSATVFTVATNCQMLFYSGGFDGSIHVLSGGTVQILSANVAFDGSSLAFENGSSWETYYNGGTNPITSAVTLNGVAHFVIGDHLVVYTNVISGPGGFVLDYYNHAAILLASNTYTGPTIIGSSGNSPEVALAGNGSISQSSLIFFGGDDATVAHMDVTGRSDQTLTLASGQTLQGVGGIIGSLVVSSGATVAPSGTNTTIGITTGSNPTGTIAASGNVTLGGTTIIKLDGTTNDVVQAGGAITYGGTLNLANISGSPLVAGSSFQIFNATSYSGSFNGGITPATPGPGLAWSTTQLNAGMISVVGAPSPPVVTSTLILGDNFIFSGTNGQPGANYVVLTSTNVATPLTNWTLVLTNSFDNNGAFQVTNSINPAAGRSFYLLQEQ